jgi:hypothetical protein
VDEPDLSWLHAEWMRAMADELKKTEALTAELRELTASVNETVEEAKAERALTRLVVREMADELVRQLAQRVERERRGRPPFGRASRPTDPRRE